MEPLGPKIRKQRRRLGLTLDELSGRVSISKPYLSLIETGRVSNPPSDEKLRRLEQTLGFASGELLTQAHLQRTPTDVREVLGRLMGDRREGKGGGKNSISNGDAATADDLDVGHLSGVLREMVDAGGMDHAVPVINRAASGYPTDFMDLSYPPRVAEQYVGCPDVCDKDAFAACVQGDSMTPKYREGDIVIFAPSLTPRSGDDCFARFGDGRTTFKRIFFETDADARTAVVRLQPRNEKYRATVVKSGQVSGLYRAVYRYQRVDED
jgi:repressor LexA